MFQKLNESNCSNWVKLFLDLLIEKIINFIKIRPFLKAFYFVHNQLIKYFSTNKLSNIVPNTRQLYTRTVTNLTASAQISAGTHNQTPFHIPSLFTLRISLLFSFLIFIEHVGSRVCPAPGASFIAVWQQVVHYLVFARRDGSLILEGRAVRNHILAVAAV